MCVARAAFAYALNRTHVLISSLAPFMRINTTPIGSAAICTLIITPLIITSYPSAFPTLKIAQPLLITTDFDRARFNYDSNNYYYSLIIVNVELNSSFDHERGANVDLR